METCDHEQEPYAILDLIHMKGPEIKFIKIKFVAKKKKYGGVAYMTGAKTKSIAGRMICEHGLMYGMQLEAVSSKNTSCKVLCCMSVYFCYYFFLICLPVLSVFIYFLFPN